MLTISSVLYISPVFIEYSAFLKSKIHFDDVSIRSHYFLRGKNYSTLFQRYPNV